MLDINHRIAAQIRALRSGRNLSLAALAHRCHVSRSMLSLVERGESSPTAVVLEKIAAGLGVTLASLFDDLRAAPSPLSRASERATWKDPESGYVRRNVSPPNFPSPIRIVEVAFPAGARVSYESGTRDTALAQQIWVREGIIEVTVDRHTWRLAEDDCLAMQLDAPVTFRNPARRTARYIVVLSS